MSSEGSQKTCFVIAPIGEEESDIRVRSDNVLNYIIVPTASGCGYTVTRSDKIPQPGIIINQIIKHLSEDDLVIADLTDGNPSVFYELAFRHIVGKPIVHISQTPLPFDVAPVRTIYFCDSDIKSVALVIG